MKRIFALLSCAAIIVTAASCGKSSERKVLESVERISPDMLITQEFASDEVGVTMVMTDDGITSEGKTQSVTYMPETLGAADPITITIEQFSESLTVQQVCDDYANDRDRRPDLQLLPGIGTECYVAYPYIGIYDRGCYIKISAGSGGGEEQMNMLINLASQAVTVVEQTISDEAVNAAEGDVIK